MDRAGRPARAPSIAADEFEQTYPLLRLFVRYILPGLMFLLLSSVALAVVGARQFAEGVYLEQAARRAQVIDRAMTEAAPEPWRRLKSGEAPAAVYDNADGQRLLAELNREGRELDLAHLKIYAADGVIQYATDPRKIGTADPSPAYIAASDRGESSVVHRVAPDGSVLYELYVLVAAPDGPPVVFELYEPVDQLNALLLRAGTAAAGVPGLILVALVAGTARLIFLAQRDINRRTALVADLRRRLERLVSGAATQAVRRAVRLGGTMPSTRTRCTLLYADVRDFTSFSEANEPERVVGFLNQALAIMVAAITREGGDVDKIIGDAVLARFQGERAEVRSIAAAREVLEAIERTDLPRGVGIGIYTGDVISGTVGSADRMDFTVIGDSVNVAARLCAAAGRGDIVADTDTVRAAGDIVFSKPEGLSVKGRRTGLTVQRWRTAGASRPVSFD